MDASKSIDLILAAVGVVNALITGLFGLWVLRLKNKQKRDNQQHEEAIKKLDAAAKDAARRLVEAQREKGQSDNLSEMIRQMGVASAVQSESNRAQVENNKLVQRLAEGVESNNRLMNAAFNGLLQQERERMALREKFENDSKEVQLQQGKALELNVRAVEGVGSAVVKSLDEVAAANRKHVTEMMTSLRAELKDDRNESMEPIVDQLNRIMELLRNLEDSIRQIGAEGIGVRLTQIDEKLNAIKRQLDPARTLTLTEIAQNEAERAELERIRAEHQGSDGGEGINLPVILREHEAKKKPGD